MCSTIFLNNGNVFCPFLCSNQVLCISNLHVGVNHLNIAHSRVVITANEAIRGGKKIHLKETVDEAILQCPFVEHVLVLKKTESEVHFDENRDIWLREAMVTSLFSPSIN